MKCRKCGREYPKKIWKVHVKHCECVEEEQIIVNMDNPNMYREMSYNELRKEAKKLEVDFEKNPTKIELMEKLEINKFGQVNA